MGHQKAFTEPLGHFFKEVLILILLEAATGVSYLPELHASCSSAHQPNGKSESSVTLKPMEWNGMSDRDPVTIVI